MSIAAVGTLASSLAPGAAAKAVTPAYGLAFRFAVKVDGLDLGSWQACSGLSVDYNPVEVKTGGHYLGTRYLAGDVKYPRVVLKRGASVEGATKVQAWLRKYADGWLTGPPGPSTNGAVIVLFDSNDKAVMHWRLSHVRPAAWKGPDLDAKSGQVALETLELVHEGFTVGAGKPTAGSGGEGDPSTSATDDGFPQLSGPGGTVTFRYPPTEMTLARSQEPTLTEQLTNIQGESPTDSRTAPTGASSYVGGKVDATSFSLTNLILEADDVSGDVTRLTSWATRQRSDSGGEPTLPLVSFTWGSGFKGLTLQVTNLQVTYTRFTDQAVPRRAQVTLKLEVPKREEAHAGGSGAGTTPAPKDGGRNPTSGGVPGRARHVLDQSDSLPALAQRTYGKAARWRDIAAANGIDDPLRVRPGTTVFLPDPSEVGR